MGSTCEANGQSIIDSTVGGLVWVRRRNGSWWPGRILGPNELPESCLVSPRSGTPVKLLGREDASVDWYNLEKSKRVKAFRCGEYDECIEKAKITASISCKKAVKYARREDAILHALELESSRLPKYNSDKQPHEEAENTSDKLSGLESISVSPQELPRTAVSSDHSLEGSRRQAPNDSEDDGTEGSKKRMRGLEDLGIGGAVSSFKRKRSQVAHVHDFLKRKNRRRQLTKVLKSTAMVSVPVTCERPAGRNGLRLSGLPDTSGLPNSLGSPDNKVAGIECNGLKRSLSNSKGDVTNNANNKQKENENSGVSELLENGDSSGRLYDVPFIREEKRTAGSSLGLVPEKARTGAGPQSGQSSLVETLSVGPNELHESGSISSAAAAAAAGVSINHIINNNGTSKWKHKRKRNSRNKSKSRVTSNSKHQQSDLAYKKTDTGCLYDVNIDVKAGHFPQHLPYISLLSKFTGQPVTGHSLEVEVLNDTISDLSLNSSECLSSSCELTMVNGDAGKVPKASKRSRKKGLLSSKKIRTLSSLTGSKKPCETGMLKRPDLACIPLKVVFGRLNAALGGSTDTGQTR